MTERSLSVISVGGAGSGAARLIQVERLGVEKSRTGTLDDPAVYHVAIPIDAEGETDHALNTAGPRRIASEAHEARDQRLLPIRSGRRHGRRWRRRRGGGPGCAGLRARVLLRQDRFNEKRAERHSA
jgi:hypothetical protein